MTKNAIIFENVSKRYLIGHRRGLPGDYNYVALRDEIGRGLRNFVRKATDVASGRSVVQGDEIEEFWALKDVSFEVKEGEVIGIIGRNGAGKSTLLKILSRITDPTRGRAVLRGRVASLLEVGTGFHPELTGRENIFLNGAILGMTQREIRKRFDDIVAFAEIERFLDTPVKHYSSGMYVRLAFAVAAHLEPEILVVDEVLAVGDAEFQKKCLGKIDEVSRSHGRTVLFVSHNLEAVLKLCDRAVLFKAGCIQAIGDARAIVSDYSKRPSASAPVVDLSAKERAVQSAGTARLFRATPSDQRKGWSIPFGQELSLDVTIEVKSTITPIHLGIALHSAFGFEVASWTDRCCNSAALPVRVGLNIFRIVYQKFHLLPGTYSLDISIWGDRGEIDRINEAVLVQIVTSPKVAEINAQYFRGAIVPIVTVVPLDFRSHNREIGD